MASVAVFDEPLEFGGRRAEHHVFICPGYSRPAARRGACPPSGAVESGANSGNHRQARRVQAPGTVMTRERGNSDTIPHAVRHRGAGRACPRRSAVGLRQRRGRIRPPEERSGRGSVGARGVFAVPVIPRTVLASGFGTQPSVLPGPVLAVASGCGAARHHRRPAGLRLLAQQPAGQRRPAVPDHGEQDRAGQGPGARGRVCVWGCPASRRRTAVGALRLGRLPLYRGAPGHGHDLGHRGAALQPGGDVPAVDERAEAAAHDHLTATERGA